jgi:hypothetical protein
VVAALLVASTLTVVAVGQRNSAQRERSIAHFAGARRGRRGEPSTSIRNAAS